MDNKIIEIHDTKLRGMKDSLSISSGGLRGHVEIYEKKNGELHRLQENHNLIVYGGRDWLLRRAFGPNLTSPRDSTFYNKTLSWFGVGTGGGEPGNPLQAGATKGNDNDLIMPVRLRAYNSSESFRKRYSRRPPTLQTRTADEFFYYKKFSSVVTKEDVSSPYMEGNETKYPNIVAEVRIELSSQDASTAGEYTDLNEAALYASTVTSDIPDNSNDDEEEQPLTTYFMNVERIEVDNNFVSYYVDKKVADGYPLIPDEDFDGICQGDRISVVYTSASSSGFDNIIPEENKCIILGTEKSTIETEAPYKKIKVELPNGVSKTAADMQRQPMKLRAYRGGYKHFTMFSRVTFSTIRKTTDREIVFLWKIYF